MTDDLISRQAAIDVVHHTIYEFFDVVEDDDESPITYKDMKLLELNKSISTRVNDLPSAPRWIPVTEQTLPNHNSVVVVCGEKGTWDFGTYRGHTSTNIFLWNWKKNTLKEVHWWMYKEDALPEPWKGE